MKQKLALLFLVLFALYAQASQGDEKQKLLYMQDSDFAIGNPKAKVTLIEYSSLSCPSCAFYHKKIYPNIKTEYIDTGKINYIHRNYPLNESAVKAATLLLCAGKDKYYQFLQSLFDTQNSWVTTNNPDRIFESIAMLGGVNADQFRACIADKNIENQIIESRKNGHNILEVNATPTFFLNGEKIEGVPNKNNFFTLINKQLDIKNGQ